MCSRFNPPDFFFPLSELYSCLSLYHCIGNYFLYFSKLYSNIHMFLHLSVSITKSQLSDKYQFTDLRQRNSSESCSCYSSFIRPNVVFQNAFIIHKSLSNRYNFNLIFTLKNNFCKSTEIFNMKYFKIWIPTLFLSPHNTNLVTIIRCMTVWENRRYGGEHSVKYMGIIWE